MSIQEQIQFDRVKANWQRVHEQVAAIEQATGAIRSALAEFATDSLFWTIASEKERTMIADLQGQFIPDIVATWEKETPVQKSKLEGKK
jgi:hypothetical protein